MGLKSKGGLKIHKIKVGDIHYEYDYGYEVKSRVLTEPVPYGGEWGWVSEIISEDEHRNGKEIFYSVTEGMEHYGPDIYKYKAYIGLKRL